MAHDAPSRRARSGSAFDGADEPATAAYGHDIGEHVAIGPLWAEVTPADHAWQNASPGASDRIFKPEDCCGFWIETPDGTIWAPGDSRLIPHHHLRMPPADAMLFDFSDGDWHFGLDGAIAMANAYPHTQPQPEEHPMSKRRERRGRGRRGRAGHGEQSPFSS
jgi:L-ascorbate metabolism protein UlaG (beta-lactamase superfamily)